MVSPELLALLLQVLMVLGDLVDEAPSQLQLWQARLALGRHVDLLILEQEKVFALVSLLYQRLEIAEHSSLAHDRLPASCQLVGWRWILEVDHLGLLEVGVARIVLGALLEGAVQGLLGRLQALS